MCQSIVNIQTPTTGIRREKKEEEEEERNSMKILWSALLHRATIIKCEVQNTMHTDGCLVCHRSDQLIMHTHQTICEKKQLTSC